MTFGRNEACCGCNACRESCPRAAITMVENAKGFLEPVIDVDKCVNCKLCEKVCPQHQELEQITGQQMYACKRIDIAKRAESQSGGAFAVIAEYILKNNGVVYGVTLDNNLTVVYQRVNSLKGLKKLKGSKYVQAEIGNAYFEVKNDLKNGIKVLFSGTPCHIYGLKSFLKHNHTNMDNLLTVDIVCHGVPSPMIYKEYVNLFEKNHKNKKITHFDFRDNSFGWRWCTSVIHINRRAYVNNDYINIFYSHLALRDSCYTCKYTNLNRVGDITVCDCWGIENFAPDFDDNKGCSLIIFNNNRYKYLWNKISKEFEYIKVTKEQILQPNMQYPTERPSNISDFWKDYNKYGLEYVMYRYCDCKLNAEYELIKHNEILKRIRRKLCYYFER